MLDEIESGNVASCITKDFSRLGRNSAMTGLYTKNTEAQERQNKRLEKFIQNAKHYKDLASPTPDALRDMVSAIYVVISDKSSGKRQQKIELYYDGAGFIPLNLMMQRKTARPKSRRPLPENRDFEFLLFYEHPPSAGSFLFTINGNGAALPPQKPTDAGQNRFPDAHGGYGSPSGWDPRTHSPDRAAWRSASRIPDPRGWLPP